ncbi:MAG: hypothetical protein AMJ43_02135 [Coxiella sp. DG_40]|nr:MAG: hypothetical protein AMJ43_02135 [Coxiella sp. DG_40]
MAGSDFKFFSDKDLRDNINAIEEFKKKLDDKEEPGDEDNEDPQTQYENLIQLTQHVTDRINELKSLFENNNIENEPASNYIEDAKKHIERITGKFLNLNNNFPNHPQIDIEPYIDYLDDLYRQCEDLQSTIKTETSTYSITFT